jgi:phosphatidylserine/phosphatidylglycerophosphate/cardiolipin synthase-like enzyme
VGGNTTDQRGALETIARQPLGKGLQILVAVGLGGYALWRLFLALFGHGPESSHSGVRAVLAQLRARSKDLSVPLAGARAALLSAESLLGEGISEQIIRHHRRRLRRLGWERALDAHEPGWAAGEPPPRPGNAIEVLIDGAEALPAIARELETACSHVHLTGWFFSPDFALTRETTPLVLRNLLGDVAERVEVRVLAWAGAPLPLFHPSRREVARTGAELTKQSRVRWSLDARERPLHCHHEKTIVIDDRIAFVGGIDLTSKAGDRFDTREHPARGAVGWHDVASRLEGPVVADVAEHFRMRWHEVTGERLRPVAVPEPAGDVELQIVRTVPERIYDAVPRGDFRILESYLRALRSARRYIYLENQFLWSPEIAGVLKDKLVDPPSPDFRIVCVLPANPNNGNDDTRGVLAELVEADADHGRILACTLYARSGPRTDPIYVHAKVAIVDDRWLTLGSANLNEHSLFNDTEMNVVSHTPELALTTRRRLWAEHLELPLDQIDADPIRTIDQLWKPISAEQLERRTYSRPPTHRLARLPHVSKRTRRIIGPLDSLLVDG